MQVVTNCQNVKQLDLNYVSWTGNQNYLMGNPFAAMRVGAVKVAREEEHSPQQQGGHHDN